MKKTIIIASSIVLLLLLILFSAAQLLPDRPQTTASDLDGNDSAAAWALPSKEDDPAILFMSPLGEASGAQSALTAEVNGKKMFIRDDGLVYVENMYSGVIWSSFPQDVTGIPEYQKNLIENPVNIIYSMGAGSSTTYPRKEQGTMVVRKLENGVSVEYIMQKINLRFSIHYRLDETGLVVTVPFESLQEKSKTKLISLELLPYFDAALGTADGYLFIPDGSGAIIEFKENHIVYYDRYREFIYGPDPSFRKKGLQEMYRISRDNVARNQREQIALPVFGMKHGEHGFAAIVTQGDHDAIINATPSGYQNVKLYRISTEFIYRNEDVIFFGEFGESPMFQGNIISGDRELKYIFLEGKDSNYVGMAHAYRNYLMNERGIEPIVETELPLSVRLLGGVLRKEMIGSSFVSMTTFDQAKQIIDEIMNSGVTDLEVTLEGWSSSGAVGKQPVHFPAEAKLGGTRKLLELVNYARSQGVHLILEANYMKSHSKTSKVPSSNLVRGIDRRVLQMYEYNLATLQAKMENVYHLVKLPKLKDVYMSREASQYSKAGVDGVHLAYFGNLLYSDQDLKLLHSRRDNTGFMLEAMETLREQTGYLSVDYGNAYVLGYVDRITNIPMDSSHFLFEDRVVPFYQIALRGLVPIKSSPTKTADHSRNALLRSIEFGVMPTYYLTWENSSRLEKTVMNSVINTAYKDWLAPSIKEYEQAASVLRNVVGQAIIDHIQVTPHLYQTVYEDGSSIFVNYGNRSELTGGTIIEPGSFALKKGGAAN